MASRKKGAALLAAPAAGTVELTIHVPPVPASRPRVSRWGVYYAKTYKNWMAAAHEDLPEAARPLAPPLRVDIEVVCKRPQKLTRYSPVGDVDNYAKAALDAVTKRGYWRDDDDVTELFVSKRYALPDEEPATHIKVCTL
jgi:Holliday junction resolvase RusA-like endonuclease